MLGGFPPSAITLIYGGGGSGKTFLAVNTTVSTASQGFKVVYINSDLKPVVPMLKILSGKDWHLVATNTLVFEPKTFREQTRAIESLRKILNPKFKLVVVDTISSLYRLEISMGADPIAVNKILNYQLARLLEVALKNRLAVLVTSQIKGGPLEDVSGGKIMFYWSRYVLRLEKVNREIKVVVVRHPTLPSGVSTRFRVEVKKFEP